MRVAQFARYGPPDVIELLDVDEPGPPAPDEVTVRVIAAGINPADSKRRRGYARDEELPARLGREFSGVVTAVGANVSHVLLGQDVIGTGEGMLADYVTVPADMVTPMPEGLTYDQAACLPVAGQTAWVAVESQNVQPDSVVVVSAAVGGVGHIMCQLLLEKGAQVLGTASPANHEFDQSGYETIEAALAMDVPRSNINSISGDGPKYGVPTVGRKGLDPEVIRELASRIAAGDLVIPIRVLPMDEVIKAYIELEEAPLPGKVVVRMDSEIQGNIPVFDDP
jgi:NADPH:quinone reductase-like Zn-dependent oxidoreductase